MRLLYNSLHWLLLIAIMALLAFVSCGRDDGPVGPGTNYFLQKLFPRNLADDISPLANFAWRSSDSIGGDVNYILYLDTVYPPGFYDTVGIDTSYRFTSYGYLWPGRIYYWQVKAVNDSGKKIISDIWQFSIDKNYIFPIAIGNRWSHLESFYYYNIKPDSMRPYFLEPSSISGNCEITGAIDFVDSPSVYIFHYDWSDGDYSSGEYSKYMANRQTGLIYYGYSGTPTWQGPPKPAINGPAVYEFKGRAFSSIRSLVDFFISDETVPREMRPQIYAEEPHPVCELKYPLKVGEEWVYRSRSLGDPWDMKKRIVRTVDKATNFGTINCYEIKWFWDIDGDGQWDMNIEGYDYISPIGTVERVFKFYGVSMQNYSGQILATYDFTDTFVLTSYNIITPDYVSGAY
ncbi:hypothetical protein TRIP_C20158 [Candidatus Zixiibacteriota bacterium]|nr:hypothetical protein TRIP_C20158 [candidate division Zixibacteria bacterium]